MIKSELKDNLALLFSCYTVPFLFWYQFRDSVYTTMDWYIFTIAFTIMLVSPLFIFEYRCKKIGRIV